MMPLWPERPLRGTRTIKLKMAAPTRVPGISFKIRGRVRYRLARLETASQAGSTTELHPNAVAARAAVLSDVHEITRTVTEALAPEEVFRAEQRVRVELANWQPTSRYRDVEFLTRIRASIGRRDAVRAAQFAEMRRSAWMASFIAEDASMAALNTHLSDVSRARVWWLKQQLSQREPDVSWKVFDEHIRPLIADAHRPERDVDRMARILVASTDRISEDPSRLPILLQVMEKTFDFMKWPELSAEVRELRRTAVIDRDGDP
jgi:hypothetical protein